MTYHQYLIVLYRKVYTFQFFKKSGLYGYPGGISQVASERSIINKVSLLVITTEWLQHLY